MKQVRWVDQEGRQWVAMVPEDAPSSRARMGIPVGPPRVTLDIDCHALSVRIHNELVDRGLLTYNDVNRRKQDVIAALIHALRLDAMAIIDAYRAAESAPADLVVTDETVQHDASAGAEKSE